MRPSVVGQLFCIGLCALATLVLGINWVYFSGATPIVSYAATDGTRYLFGGDERSVVFARQRVWPANDGTLSAQVDRLDQLDVMRDGEEAGSYPLTSKPVGWLPRYSRAARGYFTDGRAGPRLAADGPNARFHFRSRRLAISNLSLLFTALCAALPVVWAGVYRRSQKRGFEALPPAAPSTT